jgi:cell wall-associated NlpC family hydrolase
MSDMNPGISNAGSAIAGEQSRQASTPITSGPSNKWSVDYSDITGLKTEIKGVTDEVSALETAISGLVATLKNATPQLAMLGGGKGSTSGSTGLTTAGFGGTGGSGGTTTPAPVSALGKAANALAFGAAGETVARAAGSINTTIAKFTAPGMASNLMSTQTNAVFGQSTSQTARGGVTATERAQSTQGGLSQADVVQGQSVQQANQFLWTQTGSRNAQNKNAFIKAAQGISPGMGNAGASQFASTLASSGVMQLSNEFLGANKGVLVNPNGKINTPAQTFANIMQIINKGKKMSPTDMKVMAQQDGVWAGIAANFGAGTQMNLTSAEITSLRQYAAAGGSVSGAEKAVGTSGSTASLAKTSAQARLGQSAYQGSVPAQNRINKAKAAGYNAAADATDANPGLVNAGTYIAEAGSAALSLAGHLAELDGVIKLLGAKSILGKVAGRGGAGADADAASGAADTAAGVGATGAAGAAGVIAVGAVGGYYGGKGAMALGKKYQHKKGVGGAVARGFYQQTSQQPYTTTMGHTLEHWWDNAIGDPMPGMGDPPTGSTSTAGMTPKMKKSVSAMMAANPAIKISSGHRTSAQQAYLYAAKGGKGVARPGQSAHQSGRAADLGPSSQFGWIAKNASKFGLSRPDPRGEPWHVQTMGDPAGGSVVTAAETAIGTPYVWGGGSASGASHGTGGDSADPNAANQIGYDCSGLVVMAMAAAGITVPHSTYALVKMGTAVPNLAAAQAGDLLFWNNNDHVTIFISPGKQIEAAHTGTTVQIDSIPGTPDAIRRLAGGGTAVATAAKTAVGSPSTDGHTVTTASAGTGSLTNSFLSSVSSSWLGNGMSSGVGGGAGAGAGGGGGTAGSAGGAGTSTTSAASGSTTGDTTVMPGGASTSSIANPTAFSKAVLAGLGLSATATDVENINAWQQHEGQWTVAGGSNPYYAPNMHDPLNTNLPMPGGHALKGTWSYPDWATGVKASVSTIQQGNMGAILASLKANDNIGAFTKALESSPWAGSHYGGAAFDAPSGVYAMGDPTGYSGGSVPAMGSGMTGGAAGVSGGSGGHTIHLSMPIQTVAGGADARSVAQMVLRELKNQAGVDLVSSE